MEEVNSRLKNIYDNMIDRCYNPKNGNYPYYGGRGIRVCDEWRNDYFAFQEWALCHGFKDKLTLDRIDNNDYYKPDNCRWATMEEQSNNRRTNVVIEWDGKKMTGMQWAKELGMRYPTFMSRIKNMPLEKAMTEPVHNEFNGRGHAARRYMLNGIEKTLREWSEEFDIKYDTIRKRMRKGYTLEEALGMEC